MAMDAMNLASEGRQPRFSAVVGGCFTFPWLSSAAPPHRAAAGGGRGGDVAPLGRGPRQPNPASRRRRARVSRGGPARRRRRRRVCVCRGGRARCGQCGAAPARGSRSLCAVAWQPGGGWERDRGDGCARGRTPMSSARRAAAAPAPREAPPQPRPAATPPQPSAAPGPSC